VQCARLLAEVAGAIPQTTPSPPTPQSQQSLHEDADGGSERN
jgi:hypothetical protein